MHHQPPNRTSKLPVRRNIAPLFKMANELEKHLQNDVKLKTNKIYKKFSANFDGRANDDADDGGGVDEKVTSKNWKAIVSVLCAVFVLFHIYFIARIAPGTR